MRRAVILLVEDQAPLRMLAEDVLSEAGHKVFSAANGTRALQVASEQKLKFDLLITDVNMPGMTGPELSQRMRYVYGEIAVLYMSGNPDHALLRRGIIEAGTAFLQKPFLPDALIAAVEDIWGSINF
jgi:two-component system cell cycle sensor histidine kinase/response regulator CckA